MSRFVLLIAFAAFVVSAAGAQPPDKPGDKKDPQAKFEPRSKPGEGQKFLEQFVGDWDVVKTFHPRAGEPAKSKGECTQKMTHDGRFLQSEFTSSVERRGEDDRDRADRVRAGDRAVHECLGGFAANADVVPAERGQVRRQADRPRRQGTRRSGQRGTPIADRDPGSRTTGRRSFTARRRSRREGTRTAGDGTGAHPQTSQIGQVRHPRSSMSRMCPGPIETVEKDVRSPTHRALMVRPSAQNSLAF